MSAVSVDAIFGYCSQPHAWLRLTSIGLALALIHSMAEKLTSALSFSDRKFHSWDFMQANPTCLLHRLPIFLHFSLTDASYRAVAVIALISSLAMLFISPGTHWFTAVVLIVVLGQLYYAHFSFAGLDGTHHMLFVFSFGVLCASLFSAGSLGFNASAWYICCQTVLAYFLAGVAKLCGVPWRDGSAVEKIMGSTAYGVPRAHWFFRSNGLIAKGMAYLVVLFELLFPLTLFAPPWTALTLLAIALLFHLGTAYFMGLGNFLLTFPIGFPAIIYCRMLL